MQEAWCVEIVGQGLEPAGQTGAAEADQTKIMRKVPGLADRLVEPDDLVGRRDRPWLRARRQTSRERCRQRCAAGEGLAPQHAVQFAAEALLFAIGDLKDLPLQ